MICCACKYLDNTKSNSYSNDHTDSILSENQNESTSLSTVNLNLKKKGMDFGFINIQGICGNKLSKFSEINLMLTSERNKNLHVFLHLHNKT